MKNKKGGKNEKSIKSLKNVLLAFYLILGIFLVAGVVIGYIFYSDLIQINEIGKEYIYVFLTNFSTEFYVQIISFFVLMVSQKQCFWQRTDKKAIRSSIFMI